MNIVCCHRQRCDDSPCFARVIYCAEIGQTLFDLFFLRFWQASWPSLSAEQVQKNLDDGHLYYAKTFDNLSVEERQRFCESFPSSVREAAKDLPPK